MASELLFCSLSSAEIARIISSAQQAVCYAAPGIQPKVAEAMVEVADRLLGSEMLTVVLVPKLQLGDPNVRLRRSVSPVWTQVTVVRRGS